MFKSSISFITWQSPYYIYIYNLFVIFKIRLQLANKLSKLKEQAQEYAAPIMEELDPENLGYIERKRRTSRIDTSWEPESGADIRRFYDILRHLWKVWCCFCIHSIAHICCDLLRSVWDCCCRWDLIHSVRKQLHEEPLRDRDITLSGRFHSTIFQRVHS